MTAATVCAAAVLAHFCERWLDAASLALFFVVPIVIAAMRDGLGAALGASVLSVAAINFLFVEPRYTWAVARMQDFGALLLFGAVGVLVSIIAERARSAEAARLEASRERFKADLVAGVSHDLRTPLATIVFALQSLQRFGADHGASARRELVDLAEAEARRLAGMVDTLLSAARLEAGRLAVRLEPASIGDIAAAAIDDARHEVALDVAAEIPATLPLVAADTPLATRALANVILNAVKYGGGGPVSLAARQVNHCIVLEVADRGPGLGGDPNHLFEKFVRGAATDGRAPGLGLGLALARSYLESQGAELTAANREGGGATFTLTFPCWTKALRDAE
ncbi:MAG TPA: DUF4118 domain-containing protein [Caulobacterales bacterium]|nr:DUF4118 domain-containing protein [Caulobacterales bacterium]